MNEYDRRQLSLILKTIERYEARELNVKHLIEDVEALLNVLENIDENWIGKVRSYWWEIEQIYAVALFRNESLTNEDLLDILESLENIRKMVLEFLRSEKVIITEIDNNT